MQKSQSQDHTQKNQTNQKMLFWQLSWSWMQVCLSMWPMEVSKPPPPAGVNCTGLSPADTSYWLLWHITWVPFQHPTQNSLQTRFMGLTFPNRPFSRGSPSTQQPRLSAFMGLSFARNIQPFILPNSIALSIEFPNPIDSANTSSIAQF